MYYDDASRRFNFVSGLVFGAVLGAGVALLLAPQDRVRGSTNLARSARRLRRRATRGLDHLRDGVEESFADALAAGRKRLG